MKAVEIERNGKHNKNQYRSMFGAVEARRDA